MARATNPAELSEEAWALIDEALGAGTMTLRDGNTRLLDTKDIVRLAQWLATLRAKKPKVVASPEDYGLAKTATK